VLSSRSMLEVSTVKRCFRVFFVLGVLAASAMTGSGMALAVSYPLAPQSDVIQDALDYLRSQQAADGSIGSYADSGWACIAIAAADEDPNDWDQGGDSLVDYLRDSPDYAGAFNLATAYARTVLVAIAAGEDPSAFGTYTGGTVSNGDFVQGLLDLYNGTQFEDGFGSTDLMNDDVWAVRALLAAGQPPGSPEVSGALDFVVANQDANGGWSWAAPGNAWYATSADDTAAALLSLLKAGYGRSSAAVRDGLVYLKGLQYDGGGFLYDENAWSYDNVSSTAWAVYAIGAAGENPVEGEWRLSGDTPIDYLLGQQQADGRFPYRDPLPGGYSELPVQNTAWAIEALAGAYYRAPADCVVGGMVERPSAIGLVGPWMAVAAGVALLLLAAVRRNGPRHTQ
jgi:hypothetical protein